ncbi:hypothetical protein OKW96_12320 [Sphingobacterium sp. KU25419]|nr:hypothetical protein OKW96_12320 [Sphingobacterium sp. KU25419]
MFDLEFEIDGITFFVFAATAGLIMEKLSWGNGRSSFISICDDDRIFF